MAFEKIMWGRRGIEMENERKRMAVDGF